MFLICNLFALVLFVSIVSAVKKHSKFLNRYNTTTCNYFWTSRKYNLKESLNINYQFFNLIGHLSQISPKLLENMIEFQFHII